MNLDRLKKTNWVYSKALLGLTEVKSFDVYVDRDIVHAVVSGVDSKGSAQLVQYLRSEDGGLTWSKPIAIDTKNHPPIAARGNDIQIATAGNRIVVLWQTQGELPSQGAMVSAYSEDAGNTWNMGANPAVNNKGDQAHMDLIADQKGTIHAVWLEDPEEHGYQSVRYARSVTGGQTWEPNSTLDDSTCSCCWNTLLQSASGTLNLLYRDMEPRDMALQQSSDNGASWQRMSTVGEFNWKFDGCPHIGGGLTESQSGVLHSVVWTGLENRQGLYYLRSENNGVNWAMPKLLSKNGLHGDVAADAQSITAIWDERGSEGTRIVAANSGDDGYSWSPVTQLSKAENLASHPKVLKTSAGLLALWTEKAPKQPAQWVILLLR